MVAAVIGATVVGGYLASENMADAAGNAAQVQAGAATQAAGIQSDAAVRAAQIQADASHEAITQRQQQFDLVRGMLQPWVDQGNAARTGQSDLIGLNGNGAQAAAIQGIQSGPAFSALKRTGENAILSNASATGGLRGGNTQGALAQYDENLLSALIDQQYGRLTGVATAGQNAAVGLGNTAISVGNSNAADIVGGANAQAAGINNAAGAGANGINNAAAASAGGILGLARADNMLINSAVNAAGVYAGATRYTPPPTYAPNGTPYVGGFSGWTNNVG